MITNLSTKLFWVISQQQTFISFTNKMVAKICNEYMQRNYVTVILRIPILLI